MEILKSRQYFPRIPLKITVLGGLLIMVVVLASFVPNSTPAPEQFRLKTVVIDAGHGGHDPGNVGTGRYKTTEKHIALNVALKVGQYIEETFPGVKVIYTRKTDKFIPLKERTRIANKAEADVFLSIHCNAAANHAAFGTETFVMGLHKTDANLAKLAEKENSVIYMEEDYETQYEGFDPKSPESLIERVIAQSIYRDQSLNLAARIQEQYTDRVRRNDRGVKAAGFWVISYTTMPSILTELGFLSNKDEEDFLNSTDGQDYMASAIFRAFRDYKHELEGVEVGSVAVEKQAAPKSNSRELDAQELAKADPSDLVFKVQIATSPERISINPDNFNGLKEVEEYQEGGVYKYTTGKEADYRKAVKLQRKIREKSYNEAFIVAFHRGARITISQALEISRNKRAGT